MGICGVRQSETLKNNTVISSRRFFEMLHLEYTLPTGHTLVESTLFPRHFIEITWKPDGMDVELTSVPSG
jgi:hypothetical protein